MASASSDGEHRLGAPARRCGSFGRMFLLCPWALPPAAPIARSPQALPRLEARTLSCTRRTERHAPRHTPAQSTDASVCRHVRTVASLFAELRTGKPMRPNAAAYNIAIASRFKQGSPDGALLLYRRMRDGRGSGVPRARANLGHA
eukprot:6110017-Prymnesium_polylepis.1